MPEVLVEFSNTVLLLNKIQPQSREVLAVFWLESFTLEKLARFFELISRGEVPSDEKMMELYTKKSVQMDFGMYSLEEFDAI